MPSTPEVPFWGILRDAKPRTDGTRIWTFRVELPHSDPLPPPAVEMRGSSFEGALFEGARVTLKAHQTPVTGRQELMNQNFNSKDVT